jgi:hypothetical protein
MAIWRIVDPSALISGLVHSAGKAAPQPVPTHDLMMAAVAIAIWAIAVAWVASWLRAREAARAREHIRSIRFSRRDSAGLGDSKRGHQAGRPYPSWTKSLARS